MVLGVLLPGVVRLSAFIVSITSLGPFIESHLLFASALQTCHGLHRFQRVPMTETRQSANMIAMANPTQGITIASIAMHASTSHRKDGEHCKGCSQTRQPQVVS